MYVVDKVRFYKEQYEDLTRAIEAATDNCINHHILEEFFRERRAEVVKVTQLDYTWERREKLIRAEGVEEGIEKVSKKVSRRDERKVSKKAWIYFMKSSKN